MAVYRQIHVSFWQDGFVLKLTPEEKYFYLYLMTNSKTSQCGIYEIPKQVMILETGYNLDTINKLLGKFVEYGKIQYSEETDEIILINWLKFNAINSVSVKKCILKELESVKNQGFVDLFYTLCIRYGYSIDTLDRDSGEEKEKEKEEEQEKEQEKEKEEEEEKTTAVPYQNIVNLFNGICTELPRVIKITNNRKKTINARWRENDCSLEFFEKYFRRIRDSDFLNHRIQTNREWKADFDWVMNENNMAKVLEGKYDNKTQKHQLDPTQETLRRLRGVV